MKDFLYDLLIEPFVSSWSDWVDYLLGVIMWIVFLLVLGLAFLGSFYLLDYCFLTEKEKICKYERKYINEAYVSTTYVISGKATIPVTTYHPREYRAVFELENLKDSYNVGESKYHDLKDGDSFYCKYSIGRISKTLYIKRIYFNRRGLN